MDGMGVRRGSGGWLVFGFAAGVLVGQAVAYWRGVNLGDIAHAVAIGTGAFTGTLIAILSERLLSSYSIAAVWTYVVFLAAICVMVGLVM